MNRDGSAGSPPSSSSASADDPLFALMKASGTARRNSMPSSANAGRYDCTRAHARSASPTPQSRLSMRSIITVTSVVRSDVSCLTGIEPHDSASSNRPLRNSASSSSMCASPDGSTRYAASARRMVESRSTTARARRAPSSSTDASGCSPASSSQIATRNASSRWGTARRRIASATTITWRRYSNTPIVERSTSPYIGWARRISIDAPR